MTLGIYMYYKMLTKNLVNIHHQLQIFSPNKNFKNLLF